MKLLLIDDNYQFGQLLKDKLRHSFDIDSYTSINQAVDSDFIPDLILLDVNLGDAKAYNYVTMIKEHYDVPIVAISSELERDTKLLMFEFGVIDYIEKPIDFELLKMKLDNLLAINPNQITYNQLVLDTNNLILNKQVKLSKNEFIILKYMMVNNQVVIERKQLLRMLWENEAYVEDTALNTMLSRLRKKVNQIDPAVEIKTIRNQGVMFGVQC